MLGDDNETKEMPPVDSAVVSKIIAGRSNASDGRGKSSGVLDSVNGLLEEVGAGSMAKLENEDNNVSSSSLCSLNRHSSKNIKLFVSQNIAQFSFGFLELIR